MIFKQNIGFLLEFIYVKTTHDSFHQPWTFEI